MLALCCFCMLTWLFFIMQPAFESGPVVLPSEKRDVPRAEALKEERQGPGQRAEVGGYAQKEDGHVESREDGDEVSPLSPEWLSDSVPSSSEEDEKWSKDHQEAPEAEMREDEGRAALEGKQDGNCRACGSRWRDEVIALVWIMPRAPSKKFENHAKLDTRDAGSAQWQAQLLVQSLLTP